MTSTPANVVWRRFLASVGEMRTRRCTPASARSMPNASLPSTVMVARSMPMTSAAGQSFTVTFQPRRAKYFMYILKSMKVQSWASSPPCPGLMERMALP